MEHVDVKHTLAGLTCATMMVAGLAACGGSGAKATLPSYTGPSTPSATVATAPTATAPTATATGPVALVAHSAYTYGGLKVIVNLPADIPSASRPSVRFFLEFLQADGRTTAMAKLDPSMSHLASAGVAKSTQDFLEKGSVRGIGSVIYTVNRVKMGASGLAVITGCLDQSELVQVRKDGSHYVDANVRRLPTLAMTATIRPVSMGAKVTGYDFVGRTC